MIEQHLENTGRKKPKILHPARNSFHKIKQRKKKKKRDIFRGTKVERIHYPQPCISINDKYFRKKENGNRWKLGSTQRKWCTLEMVNMWINRLLFLFFKSP